MLIVSLARTIVLRLVTCDPPLQPPPLRFNESLADVTAIDNDEDDDEMAMRIEVSSGYRKRLKQLSSEGTTQFHAMA